MKCKGLLLTILHTLQLKIGLCFVKNTKPLEGLYDLVIYDGMFRIVWTRIENKTARNMNYSSCPEFYVTVQIFCNNNSLLSDNMIICSKLNKLRKFSLNEFLLFY